MQTSSRQSIVCEGPRSGSVRSLDDLQLAGAGAPHGQGYFAEPGKPPIGKTRAILDDLRAARMNTAADPVERCVYEILTYCAFPNIRWRKTRTNNPLDRNMKENRPNPCCCRRFSRRPVIAHLPPYRTQFIDRLRAQIRQHPRFNAGLQALWDMKRYYRSRIALRHIAERFWSKYFPFGSSCRTSSMISRKIGMVT